MVVSFFVEHHGYIIIDVEYLPTARCETNNDPLALTIGDPLLEIRMTFFEWIANDNKNGSERPANVLHGSPWWW